MELIPIGENVIIKPITTEEKTKGGIVLPDTAKEKPQEGIVIAVGSGYFIPETGKRVSLEVKKGDKVVFSKYSYSEVKIDNEEYYVLKERDILAIIK